MQSKRIVITLLLAIAWLVSAIPFHVTPLPLAACEKYEVVSSRVVRPGVTYYFIVDKRGPWRIQVLEIDLNHSELEISAARALDKLFGRETTSSIARRHETSARTIVAALNADFFDLSTGENENNCVINEEYVKGTKMTESPFDTFDNIHSQFALSIGRKPLLDRFEFVGKIIWNQTVVSDLYGVNDAPKPNTLVLFNPYYGPSTPTDTVRMDIRELSLHEIGKNHDTLYAIVAGKATSGASAIGAGMLVLSGYNLQDPNMLSSSKVGDTLGIWLGTNPSRGVLNTLVGGWPRIGTEWQEHWRIG